jgi:hypothetical protein
VLGVLVITGEYATGMILATFCAVPRRLPVLWAKTAVFGAVVFAVTLAAALLVLAIGQARYGGFSLASPGAVRAVAGAALFLTVMGLLGLGFGFWTRSTAAGITAVIAFTFIFSQGGDVLPASWQPHVIPYLPFQAGEAVYTVQPYPAYAHELLGPWAGLGVLCGYLAVTLAAAAVTVRRMDATIPFGWKVRTHALLSRARRQNGYGATGAAASAVVALSPVVVRPVSLAAAGEYPTGMIKAVFCAVPRRLPVLWAKAAVLAPATFTAALIASLAAFLGGQALLGSHGASLGTPDAVRAVVGAALFLTVAGLFGMGLGFLTRSTAGGIAAFVGVQDVLSLLSLALPASWQARVGPYLPGNAGRAVFATPPYGADTLHQHGGAGGVRGRAGAAAHLAPPIPGACSPSSARWRWRNGSTRSGSSAASRSWSCSTPWPGTPAPGGARRRRHGRGRQALDQTRRVLGVLRLCSRAAPSPLPGLDQLDALLGQVRAIGLTAELSVTGRRFPVRDDAQLAVYRIIQEALTNTIRHAHGATGVQVRLRYAEPAKATSAGSSPN